MGKKLSVFNVNKLSTKIFSAHCANVDVLVDCEHEILYFHIKCICTMMNTTVQLRAGQPTLTSVLFCSDLFIFANTLFPPSSRLIPPKFVLQLSPVNAIGYIFQTNCFLNFFFMCQSSTVQWCLWSHWVFFFFYLYQCWLYTTFLPVKVLYYYWEYLYCPVVISISSNATVLYVFEHLQRDFNRVWRYCTVDNGLCSVSRCCVWIWECLFILAKYWCSPSTCSCGGV